MEKKIEKEDLENGDKNEKSKKYRRIIIILSSIIGFLTIVTIILSIVRNNKDEFFIPEKIIIDIENSEYSALNEEVKGNYGLEIYIRFYPWEHPKFEEWVELYDLPDFGYDLEDYLNLNNAFYETIKDLFPNLECDTSNSSYLRFFYSSNEGAGETVEEARKKLNDIINNFFDSNYYKNCVQLSKENYIRRIFITYVLPTSKNE